MGRMSLLSACHRINSVTATTHNHPLTASLSSFERRGTNYYSDVVITERFAICYRPSVCLSVGHLSVVCNARAPYLGDSNFRQYFYGIW